MIDFTEQAATCSGQPISRGVHMSDAATTPMQLVPLRLDQIRVNPRNVRQNLDLDEQFLKSIEANGVKVPVVVLPLDDGTYELKMGHRRYAGAQEANQAEVPAYVLDPSLREAGEDFIDQLIENDDTYRRGLPELEKADALFGAVRQGMKSATVAKRTGRSRTQVSQAVETAKALGGTTRTTLAEAGHYDLDLEVLAVLGEFDNDTEAVARLLDAYRAGRFDFQVQWERGERAEQRARAQVRPQLEAAGVRLMENADHLLPTAWPLADLPGPDGEPLTGQAHADCPGHVAIWAEDPGEPGAVDYFCADPDRYGHRPTAPDEEDTDGEQAQDTTSAPEATGPAREFVKSGNKAWRTAEATRRGWLRDLIGRKSAPKPLAAFITEQLLTCPKPMAQWVGDFGRRDLVKS